MRDRLLLRLDAFDGTREALLTELATYSPEALAFCPTPESWSMLEVAEHLVRAEADVLRGLPALDALVPTPRSLTDRLRYALVAALLRSPVSVGIPSPGMAPRGGLTLAELGALWDASQRWLRDYITSGRDLRQAVFAHPITGPLDVKHVIALSEIHVRRHRRQLERLQAAVRAIGL